MKRENHSKVNYYGKDSLYIRTLEFCNPAVLLPAEPNSVFHDINVAIYREPYGAGDVHRVPPPLHVSGMHFATLMVHSLASCAFTDNDDNAFASKI